VGFQTNLKFPEQKRVFSMIPALKNADFLRYGVMHRNTYLPAPDCLNGDFSAKGNPLLFFAGQMTGVEGYVESAASGLLCAIHMHRKLAGKESVIPDNTTVLGALSAHVCTLNKDYQPMNANFGILRAPEKTIRDKKERYAYLATRALTSIEQYKQQLL
jgi:methylenetetrahydrofolate--tRNA-(uracil-5-)-methyltransferase